MKSRLVLLLLSLLTISALAFAGAKADWDRSVDFGKFKTYSWISVKTSSDIWDKRVMDAVDAQLQAKGWTKAEEGGDVGIVGITTTKDQQSLDTFYSGIGGGWGWRGWGGGMGTATTQVNNYTVGSLVVDMYDPNTKQLIWRGNDSGTLSDNPDKNIKKLDKAVKEMFKKFPPSSSMK
jgi:hypothetical protein